MEGKGWLKEQKGGLKCFYKETGRQGDKKKAARNRTASIYLSDKIILFELSEVLNGANHLRSVRVLIVVPSNNLNE